MSVPHLARRPMPSPTLTGFASYKFLGTIIALFFPVPMRVTVLPTVPAPSVMLLLTVLNLMTSIPQLGKAGSSILLTLKGKWLHMVPLTGQSFLPGV